MKAVVAALELDKFVAVGVGARDAQRVHGGLGAGVGEAHLLHAGAHAHHALGHLDLQRVGVGVNGAVGDGVGHGPVDARVDVAQDDGAKGQAVINIAVAIGVPDIGAAGAGDDGRFFAPIAEVGADTPGHDRLGALEEGLGLVKLLGGHTGSEK